MKYLYRQTGIIVESDDALDSTMFKPIIEEKNKDSIEDNEIETGVVEAENAEEPVEESKEDSEIPDTEETVEAKKEASDKSTRKRTSTAKK